VISETRTQWEEHYRSGPTPWDTRITPPEVVQFWASERLPKTGLALDLGCGTCTNVAYLAGLGLTALGIELAGNALATGVARLKESQAHLVPHMQFIQSDVTCLPIKAANAIYILDIGCLHGLPLWRRPDYVQGVIDNLAPGGYYHLFAFDLLPEAERPPDRPPRGLGEDEVATRFAPQLAIIEIERGQPDRQPCRWYLLQKP
jgi:SAM-dependent methyltransferase